MIRDSGLLFLATVHYITLFTHGDSRRKEHCHLWQRGSV